MTAFLQTAPNAAKPALRPRYVPPLPTPPLTAVAAQRPGVGSCIAELIVRRLTLSSQ